MRVDTSTAKNVTYVGTSYVTAWGLEYEHAVRGRKGAWGLEYEHAVRGRKRAFKCNGSKYANVHDGVMHMRFIEAAVKSSKAGAKPVKVKLS